MIGEIEQQRSTLAALCRQYRVRKLRLFGSAATGAFVPATSDLDFVAEFANTQSRDYLIAIWILLKRWRNCLIAASM